jgi:hypothetical protein
MANRFISDMGRLFSFATIELNDKIGNIERCLRRGDKAYNYDTVRSMIVYEKSNGIHHVHANGTISLLRLLRALDFTRQLLQATYENHDNERRKASNIGWTAYEQTLAFRHAWTVRHLVKMSMHLLPKKSDIIELMLKGRSESNSLHANELFMQDFLFTLNHVYELVHQVYEENNLLELVFV